MVTARLVNSMRLNILARYLRSSLGKGLWMGLLLPLFLVSCDDYDSWTTNPSALLTMSADTVAFDTIITNQGSSTRTLILSNNGDKGQIGRAHV